MDYSDYYPRPNAGGKLVMSQRRRFRSMVSGQNQSINQYMNREMEGFYGIINLYFSKRHLIYQTLKYVSGASPRV